MSLPSSVGLLVHVKTSAPSLGIHSHARRKVNLYQKFSPRFALIEVLVCPCHHGIREKSSAHSDKDRLLLLRPYRLNKYQFRRVKRKGTRKSVHCRRRGW